MAKESLSGMESLRIIEEMIQVAKKEHHERGDGWLIWGWLLFIASILSAIFIHQQIHYVSYVWMGALAVGLLIYFAGVASIRNKRSRSISFVQDLLSKIGTGFFISLFLLVAASYLNPPIFSFGYYFVLYAFWMFIYGSALKFRPLIIGAVINWMAAIAIFSLEDYFYIMLISAFAVFAGYLVPGYILRAEYKKRTQNKEAVDNGL